MHQLPSALGLSKHHFLCGVSQLAIGADTVFVRACQSLAIPHRVLLPQPREAFLQATSSKGAPDFAQAEQETARSLLVSPFAIEERTVSTASDRRDRFQDTNLAIIRASDVVVCLERERPARDAGGTGDLIARAVSLGKPVLAITVSIVQGRAVLSPLLPLSEWENGKDYKLPGIPRELSPMVMPEPGPRGEHLPDAAKFLRLIGTAASNRSKRPSGWFKRGALIIISFHIIATFLAILALKFHQPGIFVLLLGLELFFLAAGLSAHHGLHRSEAARAWAVSRLVAEIMRSLRAVEKSGGALDYPLALAWDEVFLPLVHTCIVLRLRSQRLTETGSGAAASARRVEYLKERLGDERSGQIGYYRKEARDAAKRLRRAHGLFWGCSAGAILATASELSGHYHMVPQALAPHLLGWGGLFAIGLPVAAVGFLSWAAAGDLQARSQTFSAMRDFLARQAIQLYGAQSDREFDHIVRETESRLLSENLHWFSRRSFIAVA